MISQCRSPGRCSAAYITPGLSAATEAGFPHVCLGVEPDGLNQRGLATNV